MPPLSPLLQLLLEQLELEQLGLISTLSTFLQPHMRMHNISSMLAYIHTLSQAYLSVSALFHERTRAHRSLNYLPVPLQFNGTQTHTCEAMAAQLLSIFFCSSLSRSSKPIRDCAPEKQK